MNNNLDSQNDDGVNLAVYLSLLALTAATLTASRLNHGGRILVVSVALIIASMKASLIGFYFMGLRRERALTLAIIAVGLIAVAILLVGIIPDLTFARF